MMKLVEEDCKGNGELGGIGVLVEVRPTTKSFSKFSQEESSKKSLKY